jgi:hypothetical protein
MHIKQLDLEIMKMKDNGIIFTLDIMAKPKPLSLLLNIWPLEEYKHYNGLQ